MTQQPFDPYHKWLGIPPEEQPPNHYRLLAIGLFEADAEVIEAAADQRMSHLRSRQGGKYSDWSQKLLNEVAGAKLCLLNPEKRAQYDQALREQQAQAAALQAPAEAGFDLASLGVGESLDGVGQTGRSAPSDPHPPTLPQRRASAGARHVTSAATVISFALAGILGLAGLLALLWYQFLSQQGGSIAQTTPSAASARFTDLPAPVVQSPNAGSGPTTGPKPIEPLPAAVGNPPPSIPAVVTEGGKPTLYMSFEPDTLRANGSQLLIRDMSGMGNDGTGAGVSFLPQGRVGGAINCRGGEIRLAKGLINHQSAYTVAAWVNTANATGDFWWFREAAGDQPLFGIATGARVAVRAWNAAASPQFREIQLPPGVAPVGNWCFLAARFQKGDGPGEQGVLSVSINDRVYTFGFQTANSSAEAATILGGGYPVLLDELAVYPRYLSDREVAFLYQMGLRNLPGAMAIANGVPAVVQVVPPVAPATAPAAPATPSAPATPAMPATPGPPAPPTLMAPSPGAKLPNLDPAKGVVVWMFQWSPVAQATKYHLRVLAPGTGAPVFDNAELPLNNCRGEINVAIPDSARLGWRWKVRAWVNNAWTDWSAEWPFEVLSGTSPGPQAQSVAAKRAVPSEEAKANASKLVQDVYADQYRSAKSPSQRVALARKMLEAANDAQNDDATRYVLLDRARRVAIEAGNAGAADEAIRKAAARFDLDPVALEKEMVDRLLKISKPTAEQRRATAEAVLRVMESLGDQEKYEESLNLGAAAKIALRGGTDPGLLKRLEARIKEVQAWQKESAGIEPARAVLKTKPDDAEANYVVGAFLCAKRQWERGLPLLAKGRDERLRELAKQELLHTDDPLAQAKLADGWYEQAKRESPATRTAFQERARSWYQRSLPGLSGLEQARAEKRLKELKKDEPSSESPIPRRRSMARSAAD
ncbi:MAG: LamG-like jellyroll fold domain-containing protein [Thermoguttaceae bacterium]|jgi:hypothetical protein